MHASTAFTLACIIAAGTEARHHGNRGQHMHPHRHHEPERQTEHTTEPTKNLWHEFWGEESSNGAFGQAAKCWGCSLAMKGASHALEISFIHKGILDAAALICDISGSIGHPLTNCPEFVH